MVTLGDEGWFAPPDDIGDGSYAYSGAEGVDFVLNLGIKTLDYGTLHLYPDSCKLCHSPFEEIRTDNFQQGDTMRLGAVPGYSSTTPSGQKLASQWYLKSTVDHHRRTTTQQSRYVQPRSLLSDVVEALLADIFLGPMADDSSQGHPDRYGSILAIRHHQPHHRYTPLRRLYNMV